MSGIAVYLEGGGDGRATKEALRRGMDSFLGVLRTEARAQGWNWKVVACGGREQAFTAWAWRGPDAGYPIRLLLVDAEEPVSGGFADHLANRREDQWPVSAADEDRVHLMVQVMETWIVADASALSSYYGKGFRREALPTDGQLEGVRKYDIAAALRNATQATGPGRYHKTRHAPDLLAGINPDEVRRRCPACDRLFQTIRALLRRRG